MLLTSSPRDCGILHDKTDCVNMSPLPNTLFIRGGSDETYVGVCTATLSCLHSFHASALALHFLRNSQLCPLCRQGSADSMRLADFAQDISSECFEAFKQYLDNVEDEDSDEEDDMTHVSNMSNLINVDDSIFERDLKFCVEFKSENNEMPHLHCTTPTVMSLNAMCPAETLFFCENFGGDIVQTASSESFQNTHDSQNWRQCWVQRWFKREMYRQLSLQRMHSATHMRVAIYHPLMGVKYFSDWSCNLKSLRDNTNNTNNCLSFVMNASPNSEDAQPLAVMKIDGMNVISYVNKENLRVLCIETVRAILSRSNGLLLGSYE